MVVTLCKALGSGVHGNHEHAWHRLVGPLFPVSPRPRAFTLSKKIKKCYSLVPSDEEDLSSKMVDG
jgi:hypothetical protein